MKKILCIAAVLSLAAPAAFGQADSDGGNNFGPRARDNSFEKTDLIWLAGGDTPEAKLLAPELKKELMRSRAFEPVYVDDDRGPRLIAPVTTVNDAAGQNVTVSFEMRTARKFVQNSTVTCPVAKPANCARDIVAQTEKFIRVNKSR